MSSSVAGLVASLTLNVAVEGTVGCSVVGPLIEVTINPAVSSSVLVTETSAGSTFL